MRKIRDGGPAKTFMDKAPQAGDVYERSWPWGVSETRTVLESDPGRNWVVWKSGSQPQAQGTIRTWNSWARHAKKVSAGGGGA